VFCEPLCLFDHHFSDLDVTGRRLVEGRRNDFTIHRALHVGDFLRSLVNQKNDQIAFRVVVGDGLGNVLKKNGFTRARRRCDQRALALAERCHQIDHPRRQILDGRIFDFHPEAFVRVKRSEVVKMNLVPGFFGVFEIDRVDLEKGKIALAFFRTADLTFDGVAGP